MYEVSEELIVISITLWWLKNLGKILAVNEKNTEF
jgi:hypothetical protein